ncbi:hypothetical protein PG988_008097 [Apiospora saccharicola]
MDSPDEAFIRPLGPKALAKVALDLASELIEWTSEPQDEPADVSELNNVKRLEARFKCQESRNDAETLANKSILLTTAVVLENIPTAKSTWNPERLIQAVKYFTGNKWVPTTIIEKSVREFWDKEDLGTLVPLGDTSDDDEDGIDFLLAFTDQTKWKDLTAYVRMRSCIAQLIGHGLVKKPRHATAVFREASDPRRPKGDPFRKAAKAAVARYRYYAGKQLKDLDPDLGLELEQQTWSPSYHTLWRPQCPSATRHFIFRILPPCFVIYFIIVYMFEGPFWRCPIGSLDL